MPQDRDDTLHVCVPPLYWYWNYAAFIQFIEIWRMHGATFFYIYYESVSAQVMDVLRIYENMGVIQIIRWQMMPWSKSVDPNRWIYRFGHTLSFNDCACRTTAKYVALVDTDEFIIPSTGILLSYLRQQHAKNDTAGSFVFEHTRVRFQGYHEFKMRKKLDFEWLKDAQYQYRPGPAKTVFMPDRVQVITTHKVREFRKPHRSYRVDRNDALLYHARSNWVFTTLLNKTYNSTNKFKKYVTPVFKQYESILSQVSWPERNLINIWKSHSGKIEKCLSEWRKYGCKVPYHLCWQAMKDQEDWIFSHTNVTNEYTVL
ncbi:unnamed protein product [Gongylonema pulchrum]|uniref:Glycosyltransferase family 92 protein n=1 Tax=Gongylonema pulchrum TaxID=637853 RepID=A0A183CZ93_9BILA|nr:unnamed protein product [Gongylonema pulchrum]